MGIGGNITLIEGDLDVDDGSSRDVMEMPNTSSLWTFDATWRDLKLGIFYTYQGDTLKTNKPEIGSIPAVYALGHGTLNFSLSMRLAEQLKLSFKAKILDPKVQTVFRRTDEEFDFPDEVYTSYERYFIFIRFKLYVLEMNGGYMLKCYILIGWRLSIFCGS